MTRGASVRFSYNGKTLPPKPASQFLLGSTPTQLEPGLGFLVLRHIRFWKHQSYSSQFVTFIFEFYTFLSVFVKQIHINRYTY